VSREAIEVGFAAAIRAVVGPDVHVAAHVFDKGGLGCKLRLGERRVVLDASVDGEWGVDDQPGSAGYRVIGRSMTEALATAAAMLGRAPAGDGAAEPAPGGEALVAAAPWLMIDGAGGVTSIAYTEYSDLVAVTETFRRAALPETVLPLALVDLRTGLVMAVHTGGDVTVRRFQRAPLTAAAEGAGQAAVSKQREGMPAAPADSAGRPEGGSR